MIHLVMAVVFVFWVAWVLAGAGRRRTRAAAEACAPSSSETAIAGGGGGGFTDKRGADTRPRKRSR